MRLFRIGDGNMTAGYAKNCPTPPLVTPESCDPEQGMHLVKEFGMGSGSAAMPPAAADALSAGRPDPVLSFGPATADAILQLKDAARPGQATPTPDLLAERLALHAWQEGRVAEALLAVFDQLGLGLCLLDQDLRATLVSGLALRRGAVRLRRDQLVTALREDEARLRAAVEAALASPDAPLQGLRLGTPEQPQLALVTALRGRPQPRTRLAALILLPRERPEHAERVVQALFGLSPVEARISKLLADGLTPTEAADRMRMRPNTLRGYMKSIFVKLDLHRQSELVRLVTTTAGLLRGLACPR
jgi:DNA-binding CsgD family transcriptional regulator